jgi:hypothetical protein
LFETILTRIAKELTDRSVRYMVIGGQAVLRYGEPRLTKDIDIALGLGVEGLPMMKEVVARLSLAILVEDAETFVRKTLVLPVMDEDSGIRIDFMFSFSHYIDRWLAEFDKSLGETYVGALRDLVSSLPT